MYYRMRVAGLERDLPICPVTDSLYIAGFVIFGDPADRSLRPGAPREGPRL